MHKHTRKHIHKHTKLIKCVQFAGTGATATAAAATATGGAQSEDTAMHSPAASGGSFFSACSAGGAEASSYRSASVSHQQGVYACAGVWVRVYM
jgi:ABC-type sugar transport system substrate-binding protein